jgi:hypothetical protein
MIDCLGPVGPLNHVKVFNVLSCALWIMPPLGALSTKPHYGAIPPLHKVYIDAPLPSSPCAGKVSPQVMSFRIVGVIMFMLSGLVLLQQMIKSQIRFSYNLEGGYPVRQCTYDECARARCDVRSRPFLCVDPRNPFFYRMAPGGCKSTPWTSVYCADSCTLENCWDTTPASKSKSCALVQCPRVRCEAEQFQFSTCDSIRAPYQVHTKISVVLRELMSSLVLISYHLSVLEWAGQFRMCVRSFGVEPVPQYNMLQMLRFEYMLNERK